MASLLKLQGLCAALVLISMAGCKKTTSSAGGEAGSQAAAASPLTEASIVGKWKGISIDGGPIPQSIGKCTLDFHADKTYRSRNDMIGGLSGKWTLDGSTITTTFQPSEPTAKPVVTQILIDGDKLKEQGALALVYERLPADADKPQFKLAVADYLADLKKGDSVLKDKYLGKIIELSGVVDSITTNFGGDSFITLAAPAPAGSEPTGGGVACFTIDPEPFAKYGPGQNLTIRGEVSDTVIYPRVLEAEVVDAGPPTLITLTAEDLAKEFAKDPDATNKKYTLRPYTGKAILLSGPFIIAKPNSSGDPANVILGSAEANVSCTFGTEKSIMDHVKSLKPGDPIRLVGQFDDSADGKSPVLHQCKFVKGK